MGGRINFIEIPAAQVARSKAFYEQAFGWALTEFGPSYACTMTGDVDLGIQGDLSAAPRAPLPVIQVPDLTAAQRAVEAAGGAIVKPAFSFPGGRRFHFRDPGGNELAAWQRE